MNGMIPNPTGHYFYDIFFLSNSLGWAVNYNGRIYRTVNGGVDWVEQKNTRS